MSLHHLARCTDRAELRHRLGIAPEAFALLYFGRVIPEKRPELLIHARWPESAAISACGSISSARWRPPTRSA